MTSAYFADLVATLDVLDRRLEAIEDAAFTLLDETQTRIDKIEASWEGPRGDAIQLSTSQYLNAVREGPRGIAHARMSLRELRRLADEMQAEMAVHELTIAGVQLVRSLGVPFEPGQLEHERDAIDAITQLKARWHHGCGAAEAAIGEVLTVLRRAVDTTPSMHGVPTVSADAHADRVAMLADRSALDPATLVFEPVGDIEAAPVSW